MGLGLIEVTAQEQLGAIDRASVVSMIRARLKEKSFRSKEYLFQVVSARAWLALNVVRWYWHSAVYAHGRWSITAAAAGCFFVRCWHVVA
jgi:hypothetical protein